jgi:D-alanyl-D-alanine dipeptidase
VCCSLILGACSPEKKEEPKISRKQVFYKEIIDTGKKTPAEPDTSALEKLFIENGLVDIHTLDTTILVRLAYSDTANFVHKDMYASLKRAYFTCETAKRICNAQFYLKEAYSNLSLIVFDGARPMRIQQYMWDSLKMEPNRKFKYLAPPFSISLHNYGCAVDVGIVDLKNGELLDMGTDFDAFDKLSEPIYEAVFLKNKLLSEEAYKNRVLLRKTMMSAGLNPINSEWWHFNSCSKEFAAQNCVLIK